MQAWGLLAYTPAPRVAACAAMERPGAGLSNSSSSDSPFLSAIPAEQSSNRSRAPSFTHTRERATLSTSVPSQRMPSQHEAPTGQRKFACAHSTVLIYSVHRGTWLYMAAGHSLLVSQQVTARVTNRTAVRPTLALAHKGSGCGVVRLEQQGVPGWSAVFCFFQGGSLYTCVDRGEAATIASPTPRTT